MVVRGHRGGHSRPGVGSINCAHDTITTAYVRVDNYWIPPAVVQHARLPRRTREKYVKPSDHKRAVDEEGGEKEIDEREDLGITAQNSDGP